MVSGKIMRILWIRIHNTALNSSRVLFRFQTDMAVLVPHTIGLHPQIHIHITQYTSTTHTMTACISPLPCTDKYKHLKTLTSIPQQHNEKIAVVYILKSFIL